MNKYKCIIVDDELPAIRLLEAYCGLLPHLEVVASCNNAMKALSILESIEVDIVFLDIQMPEITGIQLLQSMALDKQVIMTTAYRDYAVKGFELNVTDYLIKPFSLERFITAIDKAINLIKLKSNKESLTDRFESDHFYVRTNHKLEKVIFDEILYIESMREYVSIHTASRRFVINQSMKSVEAKLPPEKFFRIHRSHIIHLEHITSINGNLVEINDNKFNIGATYRASFFERIHTL